MTPDPATQAAIEADRKEAAEIIDKIRAGNGGLEDASRLHALQLRILHPATPAPSKPQTMGRAAEPEVPSAPPTP